MVKLQVWRRAKLFKKGFGVAFAQLFAKSLRNSRGQNEHQSGNITDILLSSVRP